LGGGYRQRNLSRPPLIAAATACTVSRPCTTNRLLMGRVFDVPSFRSPEWAMRSRRSTYSSSRSLTSSGPDNRRAVAAAPQSTWKPSTPRRCPSMATLFWKVVRAYLSRARFASSSNGSGVANAASRSWDSAIL